MLNTSPWPSCSDRPSADLRKGVETGEEDGGGEGGTREQDAPQVVDARKDLEPVGFARWQGVVRGTIGTGGSYRVKSIERSGTSSRPRATFITSTLQGLTALALP